MAPQRRLHWKYESFESEYLEVRIVLTVFLDALMRLNALKCADKRFSLIKIIE